MTDAANQMLVINKADLDGLLDRLARIEAALDRVTIQPKKPLLTMAEMAELLDCSEATIRRKMNAGKLETVEVGGKIMFRRPD